MSGGDERVALRLSRRQREAEEWALVLQSQGVDATARRGAAGWTLELAAADAARARELLLAWERENVRAPEPPLPPLGPFPWLAVLALGAALLAFFAVTGPREAQAFWFAAGSARASRILDGEWWRALTALTLHADADHVLGNVLAGALFAGALGRRYGGGVAVAALVASGTLGNLANALLHRAGHDSVGASTAVFGAVGVLAADALVQRRVPRGGRLAPLAAGLGILAMLGTSERADLWAHFFGLAAGVALGLPLARRLEARPGAPWQALLAGAAVAALAGAWWLALR